MSLALRKGVENALECWGMSALSLRPLAGDASTRLYYRGAMWDGKSVVVMDCGGPLPLGSMAHDGFAFTRWQSLYRAIGIRVPEVFGLAREDGVVLLEDLGDELLQSRVEARGALACRTHYLRAVHWARVLAERGAKIWDPTGDPDEDPLVPARLALEMDLFLVHASRLPLPEATASLPPLRRAARALDETAGPALRDARALLHLLCEDVHAAGPMALSHRDYHARNLILCTGRDGSPGEVAVIDFQDTRRAPRAYDLASLAWDPYVTLPESMIEELSEAWRPADATAASWDREVRLAAGQRLIKAAGSYAWLSGECGKAQYAQWLEPALQRAWERLRDWEHRDDLRALLASCGGPAS